MTEVQRSARTIWFAWWAALCVVSLTAFSLAARSGSRNALLITGFVTLALALVWASRLVRWTERSLRGLRQYAPDLATGVVELPAEPAFSEHQIAAQAVNTLANELRARLDVLRQERDQLGLLVQFGTEGLLQ